jgi:hypothetical protein
MIKHLTERTLTRMNGSDITCKAKNVTGIKKAVAILLLIAFIVFNLLHILFPIWLISEDIESGTMEGTEIEMMFLLPLMIELVSIPLVIAEIVYLIAARKVKYFKVPNVIIFALYILQVALFYFLLHF